MGGAPRAALSRGPGSCWSLRGIWNSSAGSAVRRKEVPGGAVWQSIRLWEGTWTPAEHPAGCTHQHPPAPLGPSRQRSCLHLILPHPGFAPSQWELPFQPHRRVQAATSLLSQPEQDQGHPCKPGAGCQWWVRVLEIHHPPESDRMALGVPTLHVTPREDLLIVPLQDMGSKRK